MKKWNIISSVKLKDESSNAEIISILLKNRGLAKKADIENFLNPKLDIINITCLNINSSQLHKAFARIDKAIKNKESIVVYTDYDADGVCAGAIVWETLHKLGAKIMPYVPDRATEGYGLSEAGIDTIEKERAATLIITVDHGVSAAGEIEYARRKGIDTIVIDHHLLPAKLPKPTALVHSTLTCAAGLAWIFTHGFRQWLLTEGKKKITSIKLSPLHLDLAALATVADLVPLTGINRIITKFGLEEINKTQRPGLAILIRKSGLSKGAIGVYEVGYILAPRINAAGRLTNALDSLRLLCTKDVIRAEQIACNLNTTNLERQRLTQEETFHAVTTIRNVLRDKDIGKILIVSHKNYHQGVIGLIAGKLVEEFYRPAIVISEGEEFSKASARSIKGVNIVETIKKASALLVSVGGHPMAAGFTIATEKIALLKENLKSIADREIDDALLTRTLTIDLELNLDLVTDALFIDIQKLAPFGIGNPEPVFTAKNVLVNSAKLMGSDGKHIRLLLGNNEDTRNSNKAIYPSGPAVRQPHSHPQGDPGWWGSPPHVTHALSVQAVGFNMGNIIKNLQKDKPVDIAFTISENNWNGRTSLQLKLRDVKIHEN
jgi:single-stranded-DNA-specific exonuclease